MAGGTLTPKVWIDREGQSRPALDMVASQVLTTYQVKPKREAVSSAEQAMRQAPPAREGNHRSSALLTTERNAGDRPASGPLSP